MNNQLFLDAANSVVALAISRFPERIKSASMEPALEHETPRYRRHRLIRNAITKQAAWLESLKDVVQKPETLTGLGAAALGGGLTAAGPQKEGETSGKKKLRVLRNAVLSGLAGAGSVAALRGGTQALDTALPASDVNPVKRTLDSTGLRALLGIAGGGVAATYAPNLLVGKHDATAIDQVVNSLQSVLKNRGVQTRVEEAVTPQFYNLLSTLKQPKVSPLATLKLLFEGQGLDNLKKLHTLPAANGQQELALLHTPVADLAKALRAGGINYGKGMFGRPKVFSQMMLERLLRTRGRSLAPLAVGGTLGYFAPDIAKYISSLGSDDSK